MNKRKTLILALVICITVIIVVYCNIFEWWTIFHNRGKTPENEMKAMKLLTKDTYTHMILEHFNLTHFPMFGR